MEDVLSQRINEIRVLIESKGLKGIVYQDGIFRVVPTLDPPEEPHQQMFRITITENPS
jgi:hypothetical protein